MASTKPRWRHKLRRSEELKTEGLLGIEAPFGELKRPPFRFFALPRELRDAVYSCVFGGSEGKQRHNLAAFKDPAITLVSKQARREAQSILFAGCCWLLTVGANYGEPSRKAETGQLAISPRVHRSLRAAGHDAVFRDIVVRVAGLSVVASIRRQHDQHPWVQNRLIASVHIKTHPSLEFEDKGDGGSLSPILSHTTSTSRRSAEQVADTLRVAQKVAEKLRAREDFTGYTLHDLEAIARSFCFI